MRATRRWCAWAALTLLLCACASSTTKQKEPEQTLAVDSASKLDKKLLTPSALGEVTRNFADRYVTTMVTALEAISRDNPDLEQRRVTAQAKFVSALAAYDIVTNADSYTQLLDLVVLVSLQCTMWIDEDRAEELFGDRAHFLIRALRKLREQIWGGAARALKPTQLQVLDWLISDFRRRNRHLDYAVLIRFAEFADSRAKNELDGVRAGGGLLAPVKEVQQTAEKTRLLAERAFFLGKRLPLLIAWSADTNISRIMAKPEIRRILALQEDLVASIGETTEIIGKLPGQITEERKAILAAVDDSSTKLHATVETSERIVKETKELTGNIANLIEKSETMIRETGDTSRAVTETLEAVERLMKLLRVGEEDPAAAGEPEAPGEPFKIEQYTEAVRELATTVNETTELLLTTEKLLTAEAWTKRLEEIQTTATGGVHTVGQRGEDIVNMLFWRGLLLMLIFFGLLAGYRMYAVHMRKRARRQAT